MKQNLVLKYFSEICKIPHISGQEQTLATYVVKLLKKFKCKVQTDKLGNIYAFKQGKLKKASICFQSHLDMVGEKTLESNHNFKTDPINFYEDRGWIKAKNTTLGASSATGLAIILALFTDQNVEHGPIEAVFTVQEETTSMGATKLSDDWIMSSYLINICSENDDTIIIGSGGCCDFNGYLPIQRKPRKDDTTDLNVRLINGVGGHSGSTIHFNTINAVVEIFNIFKMISDKYEYRIIDVKSTNQLNVIPSYCDIIINIKRNQVNHFKKTFLNHFKNLLSIHQQNDKNISLVIDNVKSNKDPLTLQDTAKLINLVVSGNSGLKVFNTTFNIPWVSNNLGLISVGTNEVQLSWLQRSNSEYELSKLNNRLVSLFNLVNGRSKINNFAKGLNTNINNRLALQIQQIANNNFQHDMQLLPTHNVLEIGEISKHYPLLNVVSIGANIQHSYTVREAVEIKSIFYIYELLKQILKSIR